MSNDGWPSELKRFYNGLSLNEDRKDGILQMRDVALEARRWKRIAGLLTAGVVLLAITSVYLSARKLNAPNSPQNVVAQDRGQRLTDSTPEESSTLGHSFMPFKLVAVKVNHDDCPQCKSMGNVFAELQQDLEGRPVLFLTFDLSDPVRREQSLLLSEALGIDNALEDHLQTGTVVLIDPQGHLIEQLNGTAGRKQLVERIAMRLRG